MGCVENVTNRNCTLSRAEKRAEVGRMVGTPQARRALSEARPRSALMKAILAPYRWGNVRLVLAESSFISWVKRTNANVFARLKANR